MCGSDIFLGLLAILFPPLPVWVKRGICSADSLINLALCCLGFLPGLLHAWYIIATTPDPTFVQLPDDEEGGRHHITYYYVQDRTRYAPQHRPHNKPAPPPQGYGTVSSAPASQFPSSQEGFVQPPANQAGPSTDTPPTYQQAVGDHKMQHP